MINLLPPQEINDIADTAISNAPIIFLFISLSFLRLYKFLPYLSHSNIIAFIFIFYIYL